MTGSAIPAARTALLAALEDVADGVLVVRTGIWKRHEARDRITVENATEISREHHLGASQTRETFTIPVRVETVRPGRDLEAVESRLWELVSAVERAVFASANLGGLLDSAAPGDISDGEQSGPADDNSVIATATLNVECRATVSLRA